MSPSPQLAPAGSSTYTSGTMYVGDGTWDASRNTFLLPNLQGLNFDTMRYNGMGNRFAEMPQYYTLILAHGILAAMVFLFIVPTAVMLVRFGRHSNFYWSVKVHIWLQIMTILLTTVIFILGFMAVGPSRSLTNPHHGIGTAIFVLIIVQFIGGWWIHTREKKRMLSYTPVRTALHHWFGRIIALLGLAQVPLGLTLYGSPEYLFILYALVAFALVFIYFVLSYRQEKDRDLNSDYSYASGSGSREGDRRRHGRFGTLAKGAAAGLGVAALTSRLRRRSGDNPEVVGSRRHSGSYVEEEEKYSQYGRDPGREGGGFRAGLWKIAALAGGAYWLTRLLGRKKKEDEDDEDSRDSGSVHESLERVEMAEEGRPLPGAQRPVGPPLNRPLSHRRRTSDVSHHSYMSGSPSRRRGHGLRDALFGLGAFGLARNVLKKRRDRKEQRRIDALREQEEEEEIRINRASSQRRRRPQGSVTEDTDLSTDLPRRDQGVPPPIPSTLLPAGVAGAAVGTAIANNQTRPQPPYGVIDPALGGVPPTASHPMPPLPPDPQGVLHHDSSGSDIYTTTGGQQQRRRRSGRDAAVAGLAGGAAGLAAGEAIASRRERHRERRHSNSAGEGSMASPPVSVKVKMHSDGRHVTLRRLPEEEAAAERVARRNRTGRQRRAGSVSSLSGTDGGVGSERFRRTASANRQHDEDLAREQARLQAAQAQINQNSQTRPGNLSVPLPPPPPLPSSSPIGPPRPSTGQSVGSPGTYEGMTSDAGTDFVENRRRRRAERVQVQARLASQGRGPGDGPGQHVDFN